MCVLKLDSFSCTFTYISFLTNKRHIFQTQNRVAFGKPLAAQGTIQADIAESRIEIEQTRLLVLKAAHIMDLYGNKVRKKISGQI